MEYPFAHKEYKIYTNTFLQNVLVEWYYTSSDKEVDISLLKEFFKDNFYLDLSIPMNASRQSLYDRFPNHRENVDIPNKCFNKFVTWETPESDTASFVKAVSPWFTYINRGGGFGEFCMHAYSKATGIQFLADRFGLSLDDCYVIGDSMNDLPMLDYVQHSILMGNGTPSLQKHKKKNTTKILDDGIENALVHYNLIP